MKYLFYAVKATIILLVLAVVLMTSNSAFQNLVFAIMGLSFVTIDSGITSISNAVSRNGITNLRVLTSIAQNIPDFKEEINESDWAPLNEAEKQLDKLDIFLVLDLIIGVVVTIGCLYLVFKSV